jgi:hypothetical protein
MMGRKAPRFTFFITAKQAEYLIELIEEDLEQDDDEEFMSENERQMAEALKANLEDVMRKRQRQWERTGT